MNRRIAQDENAKSVGRTLLWSIVAGIGLGIGLLIVDKTNKKLERK